MPFFLIIRLFCARECMFCQLNIIFFGATTRLMRSGLFFEPLTIVARGAAATGMRKVVDKQ